MISGRYRGRVVHPNVTDILSEMSINRMAWLVSSQHGQGGISRCNQEWADHIGNVCYRDLVNRRDSEQFISHLRRARRSI